MSFHYATHRSLRAYRDDILSRDRVSPLRLGLGLILGYWVFSQYYHKLLPLCNITVTRKQLWTIKLHVSQFLLLTCSIFIVLSRVPATGTIATRDRMTAVACDWLD